MCLFIYKKSDRQIWFYPVIINKFHKLEYPHRSIILQPLQKGKKIRIADCACPGSQP